MDITSLCRSCMKEVASWEKENFDQGAIDMFCFCTNITITEDDKLPKQFCYDCFIKIESAYIFIKEAQRVHITLKNIVSRFQTSIIVEAEYLRNTSVSEHDPKIIPMETNLHNALLSSNHVDIIDNKLSDKHLILYKSDVESETTVNNIENDANKVKTYICILCRDTFESEIYLSSHIHSEHVENTTNDECLDERVIDTKCVSEVIDTDNKNKKKTSLCSFCGKAFMFKAWLNRHIEKEHVGSKYTCSHCPKTFQRENALNEHLKCHSDERQYKCDVCEVRFKRQKELKAHSRKHSDVRPYPCLQCGRRFKTKNCLQSHTELHEQKKHYLCSICGWRFQQAGNLSVHMRRHTGSKPHQCSECTFRSSSASSLRRHEQRHRGTPKHVCKYCRRPFYDRSGLIRHIRTHTGEQPYKCPQCARAFTDSWKRKCHLMHQHKLAFNDIPRMPRDPPRDTNENI